MLLLYVSTKEHDADILTKALSKCKFEFHRDRIGVTDNLDSVLSVAGIFHGGYLLHAKGIYSLDIVQFLLGLMSV